MELKIGDVVEFKKFEDLTVNERMTIGKEFFPLSGKVKEINVNNCDSYFRITGSPYIFSKKSVVRVISDVDDVDINSLKPGDEVLMKATIRKISGNHVSFSWVNNNKNDVVKILKRKEEHFIIQEDNYGMYVYGFGVLISNKDDAKIYSSRNEANEVAADMHLNAWEVVKYDD